MPSAQPPHALRWGEAHFHAGSVTVRRHGKEERVSGLPHGDAVCQNATACDFEITLDVSQYKEGIYSMALVIGYKDGKKNAFKYYPFSSDVKFTVLDGKVVTPAPAAEFE